MKRVAQIFVLVGSGILGLTGCNSELERTDLPNMDLAIEFQVDTTNLIYQYYQKYGFTDLCEDLRMVSRLESSPGLQKKLPMSADDLAEINSIPNKVDSMDGDVFSPRPFTRYRFSDIELDYLEYISDSTLVIEPFKGEYEFSRSEFVSVVKIFDSETGLYYLEIHRNDGS